MQELSVNTLLLNDVFQEFISRIYLIDHIEIEFIELSIITIRSVLNDVILKFFKTMSVIFSKDFWKHV